MEVLNSTIALNDRISLRGNNGDSVISSSLLADNGAADTSLGGSINVFNSLVELTSHVTHGENGNIVGLDPSLGELGNNGGITSTILPQPRSLAIDSGSNPSNLLFDQRGFDRTLGGGTDIGAVESVPGTVGVCWFCVFGLSGMLRNRPSTSPARVNHRQTAQSCKTKTRKNSSADHSLPRPMPPERPNADFTSPFSCMRCGRPERASVS